MIENQFDDNKPIVPPPLDSEINDDQYDEVPPLKPTNWLWQSVLVTLCCFPVFGIIALVYGFQVNPNYYAGNYDRAEHFSRRARWWTIVGLVVGAVYYVVTLYTLSKGNLFDGISQIMGDGVYSIYNY